MARISNFPLDDNIGLNDILVGSEYNGIGANNRPIYVTKNYRVGDLSNFFGLNVDTVAVNANKLSSLATFNTDGSIASLQNATVSLINTATAAAGFATASSVTAVGSRVDVIMPGGGSTVSEAFANQVFTTTTNGDFASASEVTEIKSQFTFSGSNITGVSDALNTSINTASSNAVSATATSLDKLEALFTFDGGGNVNGLTGSTIISSAIATSETSAVSTANSARATAQTALVATISKVFRQDDAPAVTEPVNSIWYDTNDSNKSYVLVAGSPRVWTYTVDATLATSASVTQVSNTAADINGNLSASHSLMVNAGGAIAGMKVSASTNDAGVSTSDVVFLADQFAIKTSGGTKQPFTVSGDVVSIDGTLKIGSTTASSIETKANSATQASDHSTIQAGTTATNVGLGNVNNTSDATVLGNAATASNTQDKTDGSVGGWTLESNYIFSGTKQTSNNYSAAGITLYSGGALRAKNFYIADDGSAYFKGILSSPLGLIGGFTIGSSAIYTVNKTSLADNDAGVYLGTDGIALGVDSPFKVTAAGALTASSANITGAITATSGSIANGVTIGGTAASTVASKANASTTPAAAAEAARLASKDAGAIGPVSITSTVLKQGSVAVASAFGHANTGFYFDNLGKFSLRDKLTVDASGNLSIAGAISATSGSIANGVTIGGTAASTVKTGAASGATANQTSNADIRAVGAATSGTIAGISISGSELYQGTGTFGNANTGFYLGSNGTFSLKDKLSWNGTTLTINGNGTFSGNISAATGTFTGGTSGTGYTLNNSGLQLDNASSVINIGNSVVLSAGGLVGQGFELTSTGIEASSGLIGGWSIGSNLTSSDGEMTINPTTNSIQISQSATVRVDINSSTTVTDPEQTGSINSGGSGLTTTTTTPSTQSGNISYSSGKNVFIYSSDTAQWSDSTAGIRNKTVQYSVVMAANSYTVNVAEGSGDFVGTMSCTAGLAFSTSTSSNNIFHYTSSATASRSGGGSASISNTTVSGTFVWPNQNTVYVIGWNKNVNVSGTNYSGEPPSGPQTATISFRTPVATLANGNIILTISKCELVSGGLLVAKDSSNFFRINRNGSTSYTNPFVTSKGRITHYGNIGIGGNIKLGIPSASSTQFAMIQHSQGTTSALLLRNYSTGGIHFRNATNSLVLSLNNDRTVSFNGYGSGTLTTNGSGLVSASSDGSLKNEVIQDMPGLSEVLRLNPKAYSWKNDTQSIIEIGFFANEVKDVIPEAAPINRNGLYGLLDRGIVAALVKGMKEQQTVIESQKTLIDNLTARVTALED